MRVLRVPGLFQNLDEAHFIVERLRPVLTEEFRKSGFEYFGSPPLGADLIFSRRPVESLAELKKIPLWAWDLDEVFITMLRQIGLHVVPVPLEGAARANDEGRIDALFAVPTAALVYQWSAQARYLSDLRLGFLNGCFLVASRAYDMLSPEQGRVVSAAAAKAFLRFEDVSRVQDSALLEGAFQKQGLTRLHSSDLFRAEFFSAARAAREHLGNLVSPALLTRVSEMLADYRAEHGSR
jgi:TRAP-type C4-dicarboxylate transport system substrate-binding protein